MKENIKNKRYRINDDEDAKDIEEMIRLYEEYKNSNILLKYKGLSYSNTICL